MEYEFHTPGGPTSDSGDGYNRWDSFTLNDEKAAKKKFSRFFLAVFILLLTSTVLVYATEFIMVGIGGGAMLEFLDSHPEILILINGIALYAIAFPIFFLIIRGMKHVPRIKKKMHIKDFFFIFLVSQAAGYVGSIIGSFLSTFISIVSGIENSNDTIDLLTGAPIWATIIFSVVLAPIFEELIFRKLLMDKLGGYGDRIAIVVSGIAFGVFHGNLYQIFYAIMLGLIFAYVYSKTGNVIYTIVMHSLINFFGTVIPMLIEDHMNVMYDILPGIESGEIVDLTPYLQSLTIVGTYSFLIYAMLFSGIFIFFKYRRAIFVSDRCEVLIPKEKRAGVIMGNAGAICFLVFVSVTILLDILSPLLANLLVGGA